MVLAIELEYVTRDLRYEIAGHNVDIVIDSGFARQRAVVSTVAAAINGLRALIGGIHEGVVTAKAPLSPVLGKLQFDAIPACFTRN